jgi:hypothetical protein
VFDNWKRSLLLQPHGSGSGGKHSHYIKLRQSPLPASESLHRINQRWLVGLKSIRACLKGIIFREEMYKTLMRLDSGLGSLKGRKYTFQ